MLHYGNISSECCNRSVCTLVECPPMAMFAITLQMTVDCNQHITHVQMPCQLHHSHILLYLAVIPFTASVAKLGNLLEEYQCKIRIAK